LKLSHIALLALVLIALSPMVTVATFAQIDPTPTGVVSAVQGGTHNVSCWSYGPSPDPIGATFNVDIRIDGASGIWGWSVGYFTWNPAVVELTSVSQGSYLSNDHSTFFLPYGRIDNVNGVLQGGTSCAISDSGTATEIASSGVLATLTFSIVGYGSSNIHIGYVLLLDNSNAYNQNPCYAATNDATVSVLSSVPMFVLNSYNLMVNDNGQLVNVGTPTPIGDPSYVYGSQVTASTSSMFYDTGTGITYDCTGWTGTGDVPATGTGANVDFTITQNSSVTWLWQISNPTPTTGVGTISAVEGGTQSASNWSYGASPNPIGTTFTVDVRVDGASNVWAWEVDSITWNPAVIQLTSIQEGNYLKNDHTTLFYGGTSANFDNANGELGYMGATIGNSETETTSSGVLATLTFTIVSYGSTNIQLGTTYLYTESLTDQGYVTTPTLPTTNDATVTVSNSFVSPEYTWGALLALISAFAALVAFTAFKKVSPLNFRRLS
jgi:hypothetical protein